MTIKIEGDKLQVKVNIWKSNTWYWSVQFGDDPDENFTGHSCNTRRQARRRALKYTRDFLKKFAVIHVTTSEYEET